MLPVERQHRIKELIKVKKNLKIADLSKELNVSEMTIHRDIKPIVEEGLIVKSFGGISLVKQQKTDEEKGCIYCSKQIQHRMAFRLIRSNGQMEIACCVHCGLLRYQQLGDDVKQAMCYDFFRQTTMSASIAWYVMNTTVDLGCCQPQVIAFEWEDYAKRFVKGFGGEVCTFSEAVEMVVNKMQGEMTTCTKQGN